MDNADNMLDRIISRDRPASDIVDFIRLHPEVVRSQPSIVNRAVFANPDPSIIRSLVEACPDALSCQDENGLTPVSYVGDMLKVETDAILLDAVERFWPPNDDGSDVPPGMEHSQPRRLNPLLLKDAEGSTPLHRACASRSCHSDVIVRMLKVCPGASRMVNKKGEKARKIAEENWVLCSDRTGSEGPLLLRDDVGRAFVEANERATRKRRLTKLYEDGRYDELIARIKACPHEAAVVRPWCSDESALSELYCGWGKNEDENLTKDKYVEIIEALVDAFPEAAALSTSVDSETYLSIAISECEVVEVLRLLIDAHPRALFMTNGDDRYPIHQAIYEYGDADFAMSLVFDIVNKDPRCAFQYCKCDGTPLQMAMRYVLGGMGFDRTRDREKAWSFLMRFLEAMQIARRKLDKKPRNESFLPVHAALEFIRNDVLEGIVNDQNFGHYNTGSQLSLMKGGYYTIEEGLEKDIEKLYAFAYLDWKEGWDKILSNHPIDSLAGARRHFEQAYKVVRYDVLEEIIKRYPEELDKKDADGLLPIDVANKFLKKRVKGDDFDLWFEYFASKRKGTTPEEKIFSLLKG